MTAIAFLTVASFVFILRSSDTEKAAFSTDNSTIADATLSNSKKKQSTYLTVPSAPPPIPPGETVATTPPVATYPVLSPPSPRSLNLYVNPASSQAGRAPEITSQATSTWLGAWSGDVRVATDTLVSAAAASGSLATIVTYNIPVRDCGGYSTGGLNSSDNYKDWIRQVAAGIGNRQAIVVLEPDALAQITCLSTSDQAARYANLADAVNVLATQTNAFVYLDAGHSTWMSAATIAERLKQANIAQARGFSLNISNFHRTTDNITYGNAITAIVGKSYVIDTSRNGNGSNGEWCNPRGRALGEKPTTNSTGNVDAYLWIKVPGESDGPCNGGPSAGIWWEEYAQELIRNAK